MALTQERIGQIAMLAIKKKANDDGIRLNPNNIKRDINNEAKKLGITAFEMAEFAKVVIKQAYDETIAELDSICKSQ